MLKCLIRDLQKTGEEHNLLIKPISYGNKTVRYLCIWRITVPYRLDLNNIYV